MSENFSLANLDDDVGEPALKRLNRCDVACEKCHKDKVKCTQERPKCRNCQRAQKPTECVYPFRDRKRIVQSSYVHGLELQVQELELKVQELKRKRSHNSPPSDSVTQQETPDAASNEDGSKMSEASIYNEEDMQPAPDETSIQPHYIGEAACTTFGTRLHQYLTGDHTLPDAPQLYHFKDPKLHRSAVPDYPFPTRSRAQLLVKAVLRFIGPDYHLLLRRSFLEKLNETYRLNCNPDPNDPTWFCRLFVVFALGELYDEGSKKGEGVPGTNYFVSAMAMFKDLYEEPTIHYIETLLLISFYSNALNRRNSAYGYAGLALRLSLTLGLHRKPDANLKPRDREHRIRVWWTVYILDRVSSSKVGLPVMLRDEDIDVAPPSENGLTALEKDDFHNPCHIIAQLMLARITGYILNEIYRIPQPGRANGFVKSVQRILNSLSSWRDTLPPLLECNHGAVPMYSSRSVASLHLNFSQCVILTTRPIFFHVLRRQYDSSIGASTAPLQPLSPITEELAEACVLAARASSKILTQLRVAKDLATYGFFDALSIFSSTLVLMMSSSMQFKAHAKDDETIEELLGYLEEMRDIGNMPAHDYFRQLLQLKVDLDNARQQMGGNNDMPQPKGDQGNGLQMLFKAASSSYSTVSSTERDTAMAATSIEQTNNTRDVLEGAHIQDFLALSDPYEWADSANSMPAGTVNGVGEWTPYGWEDAFHFGITYS